jgi:hypothetical protein
MVISFIIALLILYKLSSILGFYEEEEDLEGKKKIKDLNSLFNLDGDEQEENETIKAKNLEIDNEMFRVLNQKSQSNVQKIHDLDKKFSLNFARERCDFLFSDLLKELHKGKFQNLEKYSNEILLKKLNDFLKEKKFDRTLVKIDSIEIYDIKLDENSNATISAKIVSEQMEKIDNLFKSKVFNNNLLIGKALGAEDSEWIILDCDVI